VRTRHVLIDGSSIRAFCSASCAEAVGEPGAPPATARARGWVDRAARIAVAVPGLLLVSGHDRPLPARPPSSLAVAAPEVAAPPPPLTYGPPWPPTEQDWMAVIASDAWIHPLDGPKRRMPASDSRVFGAERPGDRPGECVSGHCGVDLSGPWGEPVHAVHDGVVDRVQRGPNEEHGGQYVRVAHRDGTILTQYFHLAAIPRRLEPGVHVRVGEVIGLLGDTGVKHSAAHLHFTISVRPSSVAREKYIDPEPLIALWPLRIPIDDSKGMLAAESAPGVPLGAAHHRRHSSSSKASDLATAATAPE
jgi:murein DD-endopeptidase MepM/ murein hydrolase activator NlpD